MGKNDKTNPAAIWMNATGIELNCQKRIFEMTTLATKSNNKKTVSIEITPNMNKLNFSAINV